MLSTPEFQKVIAEHQHLRKLEIAQKTIIDHDVKNIREDIIVLMNKGWPLSRIIIKYPKFRALITSLYKKKEFTIHNPTTKETYSIGSSNAKPPSWVTYILNNAESPTDYQIKLK